MVTDKRIMPMSDNIDKMYEQQLINGPVSKEYVVRGAEVSCKYGSKTCVLNLSRDHGSYTSDGRPLIMKCRYTVSKLQCIYKILYFGWKTVNYEGRQ